MGNQIKVTFILSGMRIVGKVDCVDLANGSTVDVIHRNVWGGPGYTITGVHATKLTVLG